jgi:hypothetical protein
LKGNSEFVTSGVVPVPNPADVFEVKSFAEPSVALSGSRIVFPAGSAQALMIWPGTYCAKR